MILLAIIHIICVNIKVNKLSLVSGLIILVHYVINNLVFDLKTSNPFMFLVGYIIGVIWLNISAYILKFKINIQNFIVNFNINIIVSVVIEEIIWRRCIQSYITAEVKNIYILLLLVILIALLFTFAHKEKMEHINRLELLLFSLLLGNIFLFTNDLFLVIGTHYCRNNYITNHIKLEYHREVKNEQI